MRSLDVRHMEVYRKVSLKDLKNWFLILILILILPILLSSCRNAPKQGIEQGSADFTTGDREKVEEILEHLSPHKKEPMGQLVVLTGKSLLGTPYVAHTLEREQEMLVVNLRELDCTTFAENCLAIARTVKSDTLSFEQFLEELRFIRYRDGLMEKYPSRLHYFCDWIHNNHQKEVVEDLSRVAGGVPLYKEIGFMSSHPESYRQLEADSLLVEVIREHENVINSRSLYYLPDTLLGNLESGLAEGDIVGITTDIDGLAIMHVGILVSVEGRIHLLHASSAAAKVILSEETLESYLLQSKRATGIMCARPL